MGRGVGLNRGGCEMAEILLMAGFGMRRFRRERDLLILTGGMRDSYKIDAGMRDENKKKITGFRRCAINYDYNQ